MQFYKKSLDNILSTIFIVLTMIFKVYNKFDIEK